MKIVMGGGSLMVSNMMVLKLMAQTDIQLLANGMKLNGSFATVMNHTKVKSEMKTMLLNLMNKHFMLKQQNGLIKQ